VLLEACRCFLLQNPLEPIAIAAPAYTMDGTSLSISHRRSAINSSGTYNLCTCVKAWETVLNKALKSLDVTCCHRLTLFVYASPYVSCLISRVLWIVV
jgi:hypothetical protein